jgi:hypothetical protein
MDIWHPVALPTFSYLENLGLLGAFIAAME